MQLQGEQIEELIRNVQDFRSFLLGLGVCAGVIVTLCGLLYRFISTKIKTIDRFSTIIGIAYDDAGAGDLCRVALFSHTKMTKVLGYNDPLVPETRYYCTPSGRLVDENNRSQAPIQLTTTLVTPKQLLIGTAIDAEYMQIDNLII